MRYSICMIPKIKENLSSYKPSGPIAGLPQAAVLILLHETSEDLNVIYCLRSNNLPTHAGEVALPGGKREEKDETLKETALREAEEELFIKQSSIKPLGSLNHVDTVEYAFKVFPIICETSDKPDRFNENEVQDIYFLKIEDLENSDNWIYRGNYENDWIFNFQDQILWGATAYMTRALLGVNLG